MAAPREIADGLYHWTAVHPEIGVPVSSYYLEPERVLIDPLLPPGGLTWLRKHGPPEHIVLTNRLHSRHSARIAKAFGCTVWCNRKGLAHVRARVKRARPFDGGDRLPGGIEAVQIGAICPDESALFLPRVRAVAIADGVMRQGNGPLRAVEDDLLVDDPRDAARVKSALKAAYRALARKPFEHLLLAHGNPRLRDGRQALRAWAAR